MAHVAKNFEHLIGKIEGISERQFRAHFALYEGYVKKINEIEDKLSKADPSTANYSYGEISELLRRRSVAYNGAYLHQLYFENLTWNETQPGMDLQMSIEKDFGSMQKWSDQLKAGLISEPGWVLLVRSRGDGSLRNDLIREHHIGLLVEQDILLALDGWEHAYMIDYGVAKAKYFATIEKAIHWDVVMQRFEASQMMSRVAA